ncbi:MAG: trehalase-like domain-containing protein [Pseudonocardiaceae bacterium]
MPVFPPHVLREYALLADGQRGALVGPRGDIAWMCAPRWDSDGVFSTLIGGNGCYAVTPTGRFVWGGLLRGRQPDLALPLDHRVRDHRMPRSAGLPR